MIPDPPELLALRERVASYEVTLFQKLSQAGVFKKVGATIQHLNQEIQLTPGPHTMVKLRATELMELIAVANLAMDRMSLMASEVIWARNKATLEAQHPDLKLVGGEANDVTKPTPSQPEEVKLDNTQVTIQQKDK